MYVWRMCLCKNCCCSLACNVEQKPPRPPKAQKRNVEQASAPASSGRRNASASCSQGRRRVPLCLVCCTFCVPCVLTRPPVFIIRILIRTFYLALVFDIIPIASVRIAIAINIHIAFAINVSIAGITWVGGVCARSIRSRGERGQGGGLWKGGHAGRRRGEGERRLRACGGSAGQAFGQ